MISDSEIQKLCKLSDLYLNEKEKDFLKNKLEKVLESFEELQQVDTTGVEPMYQVKEALSLRPDVAVSQLESQQFLKNVCSEIEGFVQIAQVVAND